MIKKDDPIFLAGHKGLIGSAIKRRLNFYGYKNIITINRKKLDLRNQQEVFNFYKKNHFKCVIIAAAKVGGIYANIKNPANFIYDNLAIQNNLIHGAFRNNIKNLIFLGSSCIYPKNCKQPIKENYLLSGKLEKSNEGYAIAKIAGIILCESYNTQYKVNYKSLMPCNAYGPGDNYNKKNSHFFASLIRKIYEAKKNKKKKVIIWGSGKPLREIIFSEDIADACIFFMNKKTKETIINIGTGCEKTIYDFAKFIANYLNVKVKFVFDKSIPDGTPRKILDNSIAKNLGWYHKINLENGLYLTCKDYIKNTKTLKKNN
jgi:GDP-L-fucose synthase